MRDVFAKILSNDQIAERVYRIRIAVGWPSYEPGQFAMISIPGNRTFLRRPFGVACLDDGVAEICYKVVGKGTSALSEALAGTSLNILGPCGKGFVTDGLQGAVDGGRATAVLVAGGYGMSPLFGLAAMVVGSGVSVEAFYGGKAGGDLFLVEELRGLGVSIHITTEDGTFGEEGIVTDLLKKRLSEIKNPHLFACGPEGMLNAVMKLARERSIPAQVSLERYMACGIGVCLGCVCKDSSGKYVRTCREGPVFDVNDIAL